MVRSPLSARLLALGGAAVAITALAACSSSGTAHPSGTAAATAAAGASDEAATSAARDPSKACAALPALDAAVLAYPGADPSAPAPTAAQLTAWAATATPPLQVIAANVPADAQPDLTAVQAAIAGAAKGTPLNTDDPALTAALTALNHSAHDNCGFATLDVTGTGTALTGIPAALPAGPVSISFTNKAPAGKAGFILLIARVHEGATYTLDQIRDNTVDLETIADVVVAAQPGQDGSAAYTVATLTPGHYIVTTPLGTPPAFNGTLAGEFDIH